MLEFLQPNVISSGAAMVMGVLVMIATRRFWFVWRGSATEHVGAALFWISAVNVSRSLWWDFGGGFGLGIGYNLAFNMMVLVAFTHALHGIVLLLPEAERKNYNILTVAFYPRKLRIRRDRKG